MKRHLYLAGAAFLLLTTGASAQTVTGSGTSGTVPVFNGASTVTNSPIAISGSNVGIDATAQAAFINTCCSAKKG